MKGKKILFVEKQKDTKGIPLNPDKNLLIVSLNPSMNIKTSHKSMNDYADETALRKIEQSGIIWLKEWSNKPVHKKKNMQELLMYQEVSLWWFADFWLYYHEIHRRTIKNLTRYIEIFERILKKEKPGIIIFNSRSEESDVMEIVAKKNGIPVIIQDSIRKKISYKKDMLRPYVIEFFKQKKITLRKWLSKMVYISYRPGKSKKKGRKILTNTYTSSWQNIINPVTGEQKRDDILLGPIVNLLRKKENVTVADVDYTPTLGLGIMKERKDWCVPCEYYLNRKVERKTRRTKRSLKRLWKLLKNDKKFTSSFHYKGYNMHPLLKKKLRFMFKSRLPEAARFIELMDRIAGKENPSRVFAIDETGLVGRSLLVGAKRNNVKSIAMQHGVVPEGSFEYIHLKKEMKGKTKPPLADITCVYGNQTKEFLVKRGCYPKESIKIAGQPKYDLLANADKFFKKSEIYKELGLDPKKKTILITTQPIPYGEMASIVSAVFKAAKSIPKTQVVIKLHPREYHADESRYKKLAKEEGIDVLITKKANLYKLLYICDVNITKHSTTALEAMIVDKPVITINLMSRLDFFSYASSGAAIGVYEEEKVKEAIKKALYNRKAQKTMEKARKSFIKRNIYQVDGKATERIVKIILD
ncbi:UDP-N-acetylglucosamine 2-epimerase [candidate division KSB1 bacterium]